MKKITFLKTLLVAVGLCAGSSSAWAATKTLYSQNFDSEASIPADWTQANGTLSLEVDGTNKWLRETTAGSGSRLAWYKGSLIKDAIGDNTSYVLEFDANIKEGTNKTNYSQGVWVLGKDLANSWGTPSAPIIGVRKGSNETTYTVYANSAATESKVNLVSNTWYHYVCAYDQSTKKLTFSILSLDKSEKLFSETVFDYDYETGGVFASIAFQGGRGSGYTEIDNILLTTEIVGDVANDPSIVETAVKGDDREYSISFGEGETLHYSLPGGTEQTATVSPVVVTVSAAGSLTAYTTCGTATSATVSETVTHGAITLNAPTYTLGFTANGVTYHPVYSFASNQSDIENAPTAKISYVLNSDASKDGNSCTPNTTGTLTITASADGYTSASTVVKIDYVNYVRTYHFDATTDITKKDDAGTDGTNTTINGAGCAFYTLSDCTYKMHDDIELSGLSFAWAITANVARGLSPRTGTGTITFTLNKGDIIEFAGQNVSLPSSETSYSVPALTLVTAINIYSPVNGVVATVGEHGYASFCSAFALDLTGVDYAYKVTGVSGENVILENVTGMVAPYTPLILKGEGNKDIPVAYSGTTVEGNLLQAVKEDGKITKSETGTNYVLAWQNGKVVFAPINESEADVKYGQAFLYIAGSEAPQFSLSLDMEATGISTVKAATAANSAIYNLNGQRVAKAQKGLYIMNGKKVVLK